jgi:hypothetical protein
VDEKWKIWQHNELPRPSDLEIPTGEVAEDAEVIELFIRSIFLAIPLSCMRRAKRESPAPLVSIDKFRPKRERKVWEPDAAETKKVA